MKAKTLLQGCGAAILAMLFPLRTQLSPHHQALYHSFLPMQTVVRGTLIDMIAVAAAATCFFWFLEKRGHGRSSLAWWMVAAILGPTVVFNLGSLVHVGLSPMGSNLLFYGVFGLALALYWLKPELCHRGARGIQVLLMLAGCSAIWMVPQLVYLAFRTQVADTQVPAVRLDVSSAQADPKRKVRRIIWLLFDELSYDQTFEHRFPGLLLPNFDKFRQQSVSYADLKPAGPDTERVLPSLLLGRAIEAVHSDVDGRPSILIEGEKGWRPFDAKASIFSEAQRLGWKTGVVGWYNPYCRIFAGTLDSCFWRMGNGQWDGTSPTKSSWQNAMVPLLKDVNGWRGRVVFAPQDKHRDDLAALREQANLLIQNQGIGFVLIHLSVPHPPGIYDRKSARLGRGGSYIDNLALADEVLGQLLAEIDATPMAQATTVIVSSDHSWRVPLWRPTGYWTSEDERASQGRFDPRPVLMIHSPGQQSARDVAEPTDALEIHSILRSLLQTGGAPFSPASQP